MTLQELRKEDRKLLLEYQTEMQKIYDSKYRKKHEELRDKINELQKEQIARV